MLGQMRGGALRALLLVTTLLLGAIMYGGALEARADAGNACTTMYDRGTQPPGCYSERTMLKGSSASVYIISGGHKWGVSAYALNNCLGGWSRIRQVSDNEYQLMMANYQWQGDVACYPNGTMVQGSDPTVWLLWYGRSLGVTNGYSVDCMGGWGAIQHVSDEALANMQYWYPYDRAFTCYPDGTMLQGSDPSVWVVQDGQYWGVPAGGVDCRGGWGAIQHPGDGRISELKLNYDYGGAASVCASSTAPQDSRSQRAVNWAMGMVGATRQSDGNPWEGWCERFVENAYGSQGRYGTAYADYQARQNAGQIHTDSNVPAGALAFFDSTSGGRHYGHVMVSIGGSRFVTTAINMDSRNDYEPVENVSLTDVTRYSPYLGWAYADPGWPGR